MTILYPKEQWLTMLKHRLHCIIVDANCSLIGWQILILVSSFSLGHFKYFPSFSIQIQIMVLEIIIKKNYILFPVFPSVITSCRPNFLVWLSNSIILVSCHDIFVTVIHSFVRCYRKELQHPKTCVRFKADSWFQILSVFFFQTSKSANQRVY